MEHTSNENFATALKLLEEAAKQKKDELKTIVSDKYINLRTLFVENERNLLKTLNTTKDQAFTAATHAKDVGIEKARELASDVDKNVHQNPWSFIGGAAVVGVFLGYVLGRNRS
jgi:ElaB/YqjD/DUF883 family membrane-anchored ribosome-binding protein